MKGLFLFIQDEVLGMRWLSRLVGDGLTSLGIDITSRLGNSIQFFVYDLTKILFLLSTLIFLISYIQSYFPPERTKKIIGNYRGLTANLMGALLGTLTPFCSCSSIPLFIGFTNAGLPVGVTFSFLISSPLVDLGAFILLASIFGFKIAMAYVVMGIILAVVSGTIIDKLHMEDQIQGYVRMGSAVDLEAEELTSKQRRQFALDQVKFIVHKVFWYVIIGVGIGAMIHNWIPQSWIELVLGKNNPFSVLIATAVGVPMYADIFGTLPVAEALFAKGVGLGTILSFMMAVTALSLPSIVLLSKVIKPKLLFLFVGIVSGGIIVVGYLFNALAFLI
jgi:uncharacterized protein